MKTKTKKHRWLKDVAVLEMLGPASGRIQLLQGTVLQDTVRGKIVAMGNKFRFKDDVKIGDVVFVSEKFGTRRIINDKPVRVYDGEDILAIETE